MTTALSPSALSPRSKRSSPRAGLGYAQFLDLQPNPTIDNVNAALEVYKSSGAESIIALGGGGRWTSLSPLACSATYGGKVTDYAGFGKVPVRSSR